MRRLFSTLLLIIAAGAQPRSIRELRQMFAYDQALPLDVKEVHVEKKDGVRIHDIS